MNNIKNSKAYASSFCIRQILPFIFFLPYLADISYNLSTTSLHQAL